MSTTTNSCSKLREPSLAEIIAIETEKTNAQLGRDSLNAARHIERMHVAASYVSQFLGGQGLATIPISEVIHLDCDAVAQNVALDAGQEATAGAARIVRNLVQDAREVVQEMDSAAWETPSPLTRALTDFIRLAIQAASTASESNPAS